MISLKGIVIVFSERNVTKTTKLYKYVKDKFSVDEFEIQTELGLLGFIRGMVAGNADIATIYIDGAHRMANRDIADMTWFYKKLETLSENSGAKFVLTISCAEENLPDYLKEYIK